MTGHPVATVCRTLRVSRSSAYRPTRERPSVYRRREDATVLEEIRTITRRRNSYGYRRVTARVNRLFRRRYNEKRIRRVMRIHGLQIPPKVRRRTGRAHTGRIAPERSGVRWCSDALEIACWSGEIVQVGFALDCCDREALAWVAAPRELTGEDIRLLMRHAAEGRFPAGRTGPAVQWLSDNGSIYTALETQVHAERLGLVPVTTRARSPQSNGMSEAFVNTLRRDYIEGAELWSAAQVIAQVPGWIEDYNETAPHSALGMKSPREYRAQQALIASP
jgi:transposase InsO family protein